jgi:osmotically-inducible protein OsmY
VENAARNFAGIEKIHLAIHVDLPPDMKPTDAQIKDEILNFLHFSLPENDILVRIYEGIVVLTGEAGSEQEKKKVMTAISGIPGILNIWNFIRLNMIQLQSIIKKKIKKRTV